MVPHSQRCDTMPAALRIDPRQEYAELGCDAWTRAILQAARSQNALQKLSDIGQSRLIFRARKRKLPSALEDYFPIFAQTNVDHRSRCNQVRLRALVDSSRRLQFDFDLAGLSYRGVRSVKWTIGGGGRSHADDARND
jgi:hypothetical protein